MTRSGGTANLADDRPRTGLGAYAIAFALIALQLTGPLHLDQHNFADVGETCAACVQLEQNGHGLVATPAPAAFLPATELAQPVETAFADSRTQTGFLSRAPPLSA